MVSEDRTKTDSAPKSESPDKRPGEARSKGATSKPAAGPAPEAPAEHPHEVSAAAQPAGAGTARAAPEPDHRVPQTGIDPLTVIEHARAERRAGSSGEAQPGGAHLSAAEVIAKAAARDHPGRRPAERPAEPAEPEHRVEPGPAPSQPVPSEPETPIAGVGAEGLPPPVVEAEQVAAILDADHGEPFAFLGMHRRADVEGALDVRAFLPDASRVVVLERAGGAVVAELDRAHDEGFFVGEIRDRKVPFPYRLRITTARGEADIEDPYRFPPVLADQDVKRLAAADHPASYRVLGAHVTEMLGVKGTSFAVWAPNASHVSVVGDFNGWDGRRHGMRLRRECGVWEIFLPGVAPGALYQYEIKNAPHTVPTLKSDPYAFLAERPPGRASVVPQVSRFRWGDADWIESRQKRHEAGAPMSFYEVHLGSWRRKPEEEGRCLTYREMAEELVEYVADLGFTHIALLPITEHIHADTLGYLPSALYAPDSRFGAPDDLRYLVDACHRAGIGVVADWVPNYLSEDPYGLARFDGTALYEFADPHQRRDPDWNVPMYDFGRPRVVSYLVDNALYWIEEFHLDGLCIDGLAKMLFLDYGRAPGEWEPNEEGGNDNLEALAFVRALNRRLAEAHPGALTIAEDSSLRQRLTQPVQAGGLGFGLRWNSGWVYGTLRYLGRHPVHRKYYQFELTDPLGYAFDERFVLPISHDHVCMGRGSMMDKVPGDRWQKFASLRAWYALAYALPGKKLLFMGADFAQDREWNSDISLDWHLLEDPLHEGMQRLVRDLNALYRERPELHDTDAEPKGFQWIDFRDEDNSVIVFSRSGKDGKRPLVVVSHFTPVVLRDYRVGVPGKGSYREVLNTDAEGYGGANLGSTGAIKAEPSPWAGLEYSLCVTVPPSATLVLEPEQD
jgi:1,4-alpha-glucan branching enzyme